MFAETGRPDTLEEESQGKGGIYDEFHAPPITTGAGRTEAEFFVDGTHSRVNILDPKVFCHVLRCKIAVAS